ncbi:YsnF/AvaK domain-containing protein [Pontibacter sp. KCTC 32443]|uniref:YsnF/AvaK domain-containing protein n=1 Tax=Pontibacter TaxID=323449 RepID=UPI00164DC6BD|nr:MULTISPECIES: YsnF/AvaK domain-containing protein [Pontibacter]MBC5774853.1 YsnF/AvaK domain-containing protein [Pontibacter sp. KCTC 32443]
MAQTVIGIFEKGIDAQTAVQKLESNRIPSDHIDISNQSSASQVSGTTQTHSSDKVSSFFGSLFGSDKDETRKYSDVARKGWVVTVHADSRQEAEKAAQTLDACGAVDVDERANQFRSGATGTATDTTARTGNMNTNQAIPIVEERMNVGKREVETGGVRMRSRIVERPVEEHLRLREEHVNVERRPVNRPATERDFQNFKEGSIEMTEHAEVPIVNKEARVVEEVRLNKEQTQREETVRGTVRKTDVEVDKLNPKNRNIRPKDNLRNNDPNRMDPNRNNPSGRGL